MQLYDYLYEYDFGHTWYLNLICFKRFNLIEFAASTSIYGYDWPYISFSLLGRTCLASFSLELGNFSFDLALFCHYPHKLDWYR